MVVPEHGIADPTLAQAGRARIEWSLAEMPVLAGLMAELARGRPLAGMRLSACLHVTTETANLARTLAAAGAEVVLCASNPLSTQDDVAASLVVHHGIAVFARRGEGMQDYYSNIDRALAHRPRLVLDDGADLIARAHAHPGAILEGIAGGTEETTTGVVRLRAMAADGALAFPVIAVNDADTKHLFDNRHGTGQSAIDGVIRATNILLAGRVLVVAGYGWCGRGIAMRARGLGAHVIVTEVEPLRALEALMDGYRVMPMMEAAAQADVLITATGDRAVVDRTHLGVMKDGCILANAGHFDVEVDVEALAGMARERHRPRQWVEEFVLQDGRRLRLLAEGRLVNLAAAEGHPAAVMDMSFANQALAVLHLARRHRELAPQVHPVPADIDREVARRKLDAMAVRIDTLSPAQRAYLASWRSGT